MDGYEFMKWLVGTFLVMAGILVGAFRNLSGKISKNSSELHARIDDVKDKYVRRDDLAAHLDPIRDDISRMNEKLDRLIERK